MLGEDPPRLSPRHTYRLMISTPGLKEVSFCACVSGIKNVLHKTRDRKIGMNLFIWFSLVVMFDWLNIQLAKIGRKEELHNEA